MRLKPGDKLQNTGEGRKRFAEVVRARRQPHLLERTMFECPDYPGIYWSRNQIESAAAEAAKQLPLGIDDIEQWECVAQQLVCDGSLHGWERER